MYVVTKREYKMWWVEQDMISSDKLNGLDLSMKLLGTLRNSSDLNVWRESCTSFNTLRKCCSSYNIPQQQSRLLYFKE